MARNPKVELRGHEGQVVHPITDGDCVIFPSGETLSHKLSEQEEVMYAPEVTNSSPMFKVGEGDSSDYSANVLDGAYQEAVLKGQTYVNTIQERSADVITLPTPFTEYERTQSKTFTEMQDGTFGLNLVGQSYVNCIQEPSEPSYVALGENLEFQNKKVEYTSDGQIKSAMLNGQTLVNIFTRANKGHLYSTTNNGKKGFTMIGDGTMPCHSWWSLELSTTKQYILTFDININTLDQVFIIKGNDEQTITYFPIGTTGKQTVIFTPTASGIRFKVEQDVNGTIIVDNIMLLEYQEGMENWDIPYFQGMQSVTMTTELENVCSRYNSSVAKNGKTFTVGTSTTRYLELSTSANIGSYDFKQNTKYLMQFKISNLNLDGLGSITLVFSNGSIAQGNALFGDSSQVAITKNGVYRVILTTSNVIGTSDFIVKGAINEWEETTSTSRTLTISQIMCIEYQNGMENWDLPYFETTQLMKPLKVQSVNKNLVNKNDFIENTMLAWATGHYTPGGDIYAQTSEIYYPIKYSSTYTISGIQGTRHICFYDKDRNALGFLGNDNTISSLGTQGIGNWTQFCLSQYPNVAYCRISIRGLNEAKQDLSQLQFEESSTATDYIPHQSKTTSALEPITLRAIGDVKDTLDLSTGEYVQRIGEIVLDENTDKTILLQSTNDSGIANFWIQGITFKAGTKNICDRLIKQETVIADTTSEGFMMTNSNTLYVRLLSSKASTVDEFKTWLQTNPLKFQYILAKPITRKISLEYPNLQTYQDITHVQSIAMDGTLIPKIFLPSDISYKAMLKPNTSYNVIVDREVIDSTNQLTVNLGGTTANITANRTIVTTPSTLSNETLTFSGKDNRIAKAMLIEGSTLINGDLPHFDGIGDVKLGRVVENLCMSNEYADGNGRTTDTYSNNSITSKFTASGSRVYLFDLIKPVQNGKKYFVYAPCSQTCAIGFKTIYNGASLFSVARTNIDNYTILSIDNEILRECRLFIGQLGAMPVNTTMTIRRPILCEYIDGMENWDWESIGYFTGTKNVGNEFMRVQNKNLFDGVLEEGSIGSNGENYSYHPTNANHKRSVNFIDVKGSTQYSISNYNLQKPMVFEYDKNHNLLTHYNHLDSFTTRENTKYIRLRMHNNDTGIIQLEEASSATSYVAHKHNSLHILPNEQIPLTFVQGATVFSNTTSFTEQINNTMTTRIRTGLLDLEPNETYRISCGDKNYIQATAFYNNSNIGAYTLGRDSNDYVFTTTKDVHKICINIAKSDMDANITPSVLHQVRLEKVTDVTLRSVRGVCDELDVARGVYIQRINEVVLNGSGSISLNTPYSTDNVLCFDIYDNKKGKIYEQSYAGGLICDKLIPRNWIGFYSSKIDEEGIVLNRDNGTVLLVKIAKSKLATENVDGFKAYLKSNPIKVQYELATPIKHKINIPMKNELNQTIAKPNGIFTLPLMYNGDNHVDINTQIYPKVQSRDYISYPVIANNSQLHTVFHNKVGTGNLTVNLCGTSVTSVDGTSKCTITTPSTISQYELRLSGARNKVSNVCVFSGDYMNVNVPYVQGMMNAVNPIVKNIIGEDLNTSKSKSVGMYFNFILKEVKQNTTYIVYIDISGDEHNLPVMGFLNAEGNNWNVKKVDCPLGKNFIEFTTTSSITLQPIFRIHRKDYIQGLYNETLYINNFMIFEKQSYQENICEPKNGQVYLTQDMFEQGSMGGVNGANYDKSTSVARIRTKELIKVSPSTSYIFKMYDNYNVWIKEFDAEGKQSNESIVAWLNNGIFTTKENTEYISFIIRKGTNNTSISVSEFDNINPYLCELDKEITLRSLPNGVRDELNLQTGEYIQRIGEYVWDGSVIGTTTVKNGIRFYYIYLDDCIGENWSNETIICKDKNVGVLGSLYPSDTWKDNTIVSIGSYFMSSKNGIGLFSSIDSSYMSTYLRENPIIIQYELATPIIKQIDINNFPHSYKDGHVIIENNDPTTSVPAQLTYKCVTNRSGQIQEHTEQVEKQEHEINELETLILENIRQQQNR